MNIKTYMTQSNLVIFLMGILIGLFGWAFVSVITMPIEIVLLLTAILVVFLIIELNNAKEVKWVKLLGIVIGALLAFLVPVLSPLALGGVSPFLLFLVLIYLVIK